MKKLPINELLRCSSSSFLGLAVMKDLFGLSMAFLIWSGESIVLDLARGEGDSTCVLLPIVIVRASGDSFEGECFIKTVFLRIGELFGIVLNPESFVDTQVPLSRTEGPFKNF